MKRRRLLGLIGEIQEEYIEEIYIEDRNIWIKKEKTGNKADFEKNAEFESRFEFEKSVEFGSKADFEKDAEFRSKADFEKSAKFGSKTDFGNRAALGEEGLTADGAIPRKRIFLRKAAKKEDALIGSRRRFLCGAAAVCFILLAGSVFVGRLSDFSGHGKTFDRVLVDGMQAGNFLKAPTLQMQLENTELYLAKVRVGERVAVYEWVEPYEMGIPDILQLDVTTRILKGRIGEFYQEEGGRRWYRLKDSNNLSALIGEEENGLLRLWEYDHFLVASAPAPEERKEGIVYFADQFPDADLSPYTYGEMFSVIYGLTSATEIESITAEAIKVNSLEIGKEIQQQVGSHTYKERAQIESIYDAIVNVICNGGSGSWFDQENRFIYRFSTDAKDKVASGETTYASRSLLICMTDGTVIEQLTYDALKGCIYQPGGIFSEFLTEEAVETLNEIFGIE